MFATASDTVVGDDFAARKVRKVRLLVSYPRGTQPDPQRKNVELVRE